MTDKPKIHASVKDLETEGKPEPFVFMAGTKRVTFPDLFDLEWEEGEQFLVDLESRSNSYILKEWLSEKDYEALKSAKLTLRQLGILIEKVMAHYQGIAGSPGEGNASEN